MEADFATCRRFRPDYSPDALVTIGTDAALKDAHVFQSSGNDSRDRAAVVAVCRYVFRPARRGHELVEAKAIVTIDGEILGSRASGAGSRPH